ncbi:glycoside hydrolase family 79 [Ophiocordyceps sinensis CO18]|uniref:alpha-1,2-Mannosidase n=1 Tax=Ophiocordyceps sinensis (strain Co18 / CGMCC 3.14243) TaxID=911162 RepID=T5A786_OPHSC|nr:glycoside hydrolase family 79 [Ophiocordyceps sinensis CO18]
MPKRRYRLFALCAIVVFLLYRLVQNPWTPALDLAATRRPPPPAPEAAPQGPNRAHAKSLVANRPQEPLNGESGHDDKSKPAHVVQGKAGGDERVDLKPPPSSKDATKEGKPGGTDSRPSKPGAHDGTSPDKTNKDEVPQGWKTPPKGAAPESRPPADGQVHWTKPEEHFPLSKESIIPLPTGAASKVPKVQFDFAPESKQAKDTRLQRQRKVKMELARSWAGYRKHAWMHDELSPDSGRSRDPFCGWAATLVDALDTLWIAGMKKEFDEAAKAVKDIDFTYTPRPEIPVFETTIRYLGGLIAAFDVSGGSQGNYSFLLDKATELAEILMGIFDTPNRMPLLYYRWKPEYTSQPHSAGQVGVAELATLSMEFTRLAQITFQDKYYDAIDRITNALVDLQKRGTLIPGLFPESLDASGCNRTVASLQDSLSKGAKEQMNSQEVLGEPEGFGGQSKGLRSILDSNRQKELDSALEGQKQRRFIRDSTMASSDGTTMSKKKRDGPFAADGKGSRWDCEPQGLVPGGNGLQSFHVGGGQDSAYEYFPKEYQLLGGRESKYRKLYEDAVSAINKWLIFRPMIEGSWNVLFPAKLSTYGDSVQDFRYEYEVAHLTCFVGGMYGLGGKLFDREEDIETAKKLTNGCVWAYQSTLSGIMPESGHVLPCSSKDRCDFNKTRWWEELDQSKGRRDEQVKEWEAEHGSKKVRRAASLEDDEADYDGSKLPPSLRKKVDQGLGAMNGRLKTGKGSKLDVPKSSLAGDDTEEAAEDDSDRPAKPKRPVPRASMSDVSVAENPQSHEQFVLEKIERERLPPGFVKVPSTSYLLRPEAIESVWYMYRITGDVEWMDKGWQMFEATVRATRTSIANSAVDNVLLEEPRTKDEMESFWIAETLKYYFLLFSEPDVISLDEWVLNTEAHPFRL